MRRSVRVHTIQGGLWGALAGLTDEELTPRVLNALGRCMVAALSSGATKYLTRVGHSGLDPQGGPSLPQSFSFIVRGTDVEIRSSFYGMAQLAHGSVPSRRMPWLTQEHKKQHPERFQQTARERQVGHRLPLVVPIKGGDGTIEFRMAPLKIGDAWVHPGIAKFTFFETAIRNGRKQCVKTIQRLANK